MAYRGLKAALLACSGIGVLLAVTADANAGGLAVREQSAYGLGSSFAGVAAGGSLSSMFWNPATMTQVPGIQVEAVATGILPHNSNTATSGTFVGVPFATTVGNSGINAIVPASYLSWQVNPQLWLGLSINAPFGLSVGFPDNFAGRNYAGDTSLKTYNFTPSIAYALNNWISVGAGVQIQYAKADFSSGLPINRFGVVTGGLGNVANISGSGWGYGFTAGVTLTPTPATTIGIGYRSAIDQKISGTLTMPPGGFAFAAPASTPGDVNTTLNLPSMVSIGLRHRLNQQWMLLGTVEWTNWSRIGTSNVMQGNGSPALVATKVLKVPFEYSDGWFYSLGAEYQWNPQLAVRGGIGFEKSPITDAVRTPRLPDNDRIWLSMGGTYQVTQKMALDFAYSHIFIKDSSINISAASGNPSFSGVTYIGNASGHADIVSVALKYRWDDPAPAPMKQRYAK